MPAWFPGVHFSGLQKGLAWHKVGQMRIACVQRCERLNSKRMKIFLAIVGWCILFVLCWPLAILALVLFPVVWLLLLPLRLIGITVAAVFALLRVVLFLPARLLGYRRPSTRHA